MEAAAAASDDFDDEGGGGLGHIDLGLREITPQDYNEHTSHFYTSGPRGGDEQYERSNLRALHITRTGNTVAASPATPISALGNTSRGSGVSGRMRGELPAGWIQEPVPNYPMKLRWWRSAAHKAEDMKPLRSWPAVVGELKKSGQWVEPAATPEPAHSRWNLPASRNATPDEPPLPEKTKHEKTLARQVKWSKDKKDAEIVALRDVGHDVYLIERRQIVELMSVQLARVSKCKTKGCEGRLGLTSSTTTGHGGSVVMWFRCSGCSRSLIFHGSSQLQVDRAFGGETGKGLYGTVGFMEVITSLMNGELYHTYAKGITKRGGVPYNDTRFRDAVNWLYPYVKLVLERQCNAEHARMQAPELACAVLCVSRYFAIESPLLSITPLPPTASTAGRYFLHTLHALREFRLF